MTRHGFCLSCGDDVRLPGDVPTLGGPVPAHCAACWEGEPGRRFREVVDRILGREVRAADVRVGDVARVDGWPAFVVDSVRPVAGGIELAGRGRGGWAGPQWRGLADAPVRVGGVAP